MTRAQERPDLLRIDDALIRLRRLWQGHDSPAGLSRQSGAGVEMSTVLVTDAVHRGLHDGEDVSVAHVAARLDVTHSTASRLVERAVAAGMVSRSRAADDHRRVTLRVTADGERLVRRSVQFRVRYLRALLHDWSDADVATFATLLARFATTARTPPDPQEPHHD